MDKITMRLISFKDSITVILSTILLYSSVCCEHPVSAQSIGYHPQFNFGFNPHLSPVFGYGLGLPFGAYNMSPTRNPWLVNFDLLPHTDKSGLMSKLHAKAFLKKLTSSQILSARYYGMIDKLNLIKHPQYAYTPYGTSYGYGGHYGAATVPNNPYKSTYSGYYDSVQPSMSKPVSGPILDDKDKTGQIQIGGRLPEGQSSIISAGIETKPKSLYLKPLIKAGALITAALLGKKVLGGPHQLNPSGMILSEVRP